MNNPNEKLYRIYTEDKEEPYFFGGVMQYFDNFTTYKSIGHWKGTQEKGIVIEVITDKPFLVRSLAYWIKGYLHQEAVLITEQEIKSELI